MIVTGSPVLVARLRRLQGPALATVGLLVGHHAVYLATYGSAYHEAMARGGHAYWLSFALLVTLLAAIPLMLAVLTVGRLRVALSGRRPPRDARERGDPARALAGTTIRLTAILVTGYTVQENVEQALAGLTPAGLYVLEPALVLPVLAAISLLLAVAGSWLRWRERLLRRRLAASSAREPDGLHAAQDLPIHWRHVGAIVASAWLAARPAGRAPPLRSVA